VTRNGVDTSTLILVTILSHPLHHHGVPRHPFKFLRAHADQPQVNVRGKKRRYSFHSRAPSCQLTHECLRVAAAPTPANDVAAADWLGSAELVSAIQWECGTGLVVQ
jgi:hypothetical protein